MTKDPAPPVSPEGAADTSSEGVAATTPTRPTQPERKAGEIRARPHRPTQPPLAPGEHALQLSSSRDGVLYVPPTRAATPPLLLLLHGAGGRAQQMLHVFRALSDRLGVVLLIPESREPTWDVIVEGDFGSDVVFVDRALSLAFDHFEVPEDRAAIAGFSDGASYALSLGLTNGSLFRHILAFSPGFATPARLTGSPRVFVSHGTRDTVLAIDRTSRRIVPYLRSRELEVDYREFDGPHVMPESVLETALANWLRSTP